MNGVTVSVSDEINKSLDERSWSLTVINDRDVMMIASLATYSQLLSGRKEAG